MVGLRVENNNTTDGRRRTITTTMFMTLDGVVQGLGRADEDTRGDFGYGGWGPPYNDDVMVDELDVGTRAGPLAVRAFIGSVARVNLRRVLLPVVAASLTLGLAACGADSDTGSAQSSSPATTTCPSAAPASSDKPAWSLRGTTGHVNVVASTSTTAPAINMTTPFAVDETVVHTLRAGDGEVVPDTATVNVCYLGVNGRDGKQFDSSYVGGLPAQFSLDRVVTGFRKAIAGQKIGSSVAVAMTSEDGYPDGNAAAGIDKGDTLVFELTIVSVDG